MGSMMPGPEGLDVWHHLFGAASWRKWPALGMRWSSLWREICSHIWVRALTSSSSSFTPR